jgi:NAD+--dinitrogen-reductase ADP-D-ribosyltransferase
VPEELQDAPARTALAPAPAPAPVDGPEARLIDLLAVVARNQDLFRGFDDTEQPEARARQLDEWITERFRLGERPGAATGRRSPRNSYLRFLRGWGQDSNTPEGAVLKAWVESRVGIPPTFHHARLDRDDGQARRRYMHDWLEGNTRSTSVFEQLDLVYAFTQYELARRAPGDHVLSLWRGQYDAGEHEVVERLGPRELMVRLNNLCSFTDDPELAWEFGSTVWEVRVSRRRIFFASWLHDGVLQGEREALVMCGKLPVRQVLA